MGKDKAMELITTKTEIFSMGNGVMIKDTAENITLTSKDMTKTCSRASLSMGRYHLGLLPMGELGNPTMDSSKRGKGTELVNIEIRTEL